MAKQSVRNEVSNEEAVQAKIGELVIEKQFDISGKDLPDVKGFRVQIVYKDMTEMTECAAAYSVVMTQNKIRAHYRKHHAWLIKPGDRVTVDARGNHTLTQEEKVQRAIDALISKPEVLANVTDEQREQLSRLLGLSK